jgi:hypothetical protein
MGNFSSSVGCGKDVSVHSVAHLQGRGDQGSRQAQVADGPGARSRWGAESASRGRGVMPRRGIGALQQSPRAWSARGEAWVRCGRTCERGSGAVGTFLGLRMTVGMANAVGMTHAGTGARARRRWKNVAGGLRLVSSRAEPVKWAGPRLAFLF